MALFACKVGGSEGGIDPIETTPTIFAVSCGWGTQLSTALKQGDIVFISAYANEAGSVNISAPNCTTLRDVGGGINGNPCRVIRANADTTLSLGVNKGSYTDALHNSSFGVRYE